MRTEREETDKKKFGRVIKEMRGRERHRNKEKRKERREQRKPFRRQHVNTPAAGLLSGDEEAVG